MRASRPPVLTLTLALKRDDAPVPRSRRHFRPRRVESAQYSARRRLPGGGARRARRVRPAAVLAAGLALGMAPVVLRNVVVSHQWSLVSSHGGLNFYIGNSESATGFFHPIPGISPNITGQAEDARRVAERAVGHALTDAQTSDYFFGLAWTWIAAHPMEALGLFARKVGFVFSAQHVALPHSYPFYAYDADTALRFLFVGPWLLIPLGSIGLVAAAPADRRSDYFVWASFVPGYTIGVAAFFVAERYRLPLLVPLCVGAGAALDGAARLVADGRVRRLAAPAAAFALVFAFANWPRDLRDGRWEEGIRMAQRLIMEGRCAEADGWVQRSVRGSRTRGHALRGRIAAAARRPAGGGVALPDRGAGPRSGAAGRRARSVRRCSPPAAPQTRSRTFVAASMPVSRFRRVATTWLSRSRRPATPPAPSRSCSGCTRRTLTLKPGCAPAGWRPSCAPLRSRSRSSAGRSQSGRTRPAHTSSWA